MCPKVHSPGADFRTLSAPCTVEYKEVNIMANFHSVTPEIAEQLKAIVGEKRFQYGDKVKEDYTHDEMPIYGKFAPEAVCEV